MYGNMNTIRALIAVVLLGLPGLQATGQTLALHGQLSGWGTAAPDAVPAWQSGVRYIPTLTAQTQLSDGLNLDMESSVNGWLSGGTINRQHPSFDATLKPYRAWLRLFSDEFELRAGLQKINFGSATLFRSLMWFDKMDPRDPLQLTDGVYGLLGRYYFLDNANLWLWGLYGNKDTKGWEIASTTKHTVEVGGRAQVPLFSGEFGVSYHHRRADFSTVIPILAQTGPNSVPEDRYAIDGKWNAGVGLWCEAVLVHDRIDVPGLEYSRQWTLGVDNTFDVGSGLTALMEYFRYDTPSKPFSSVSGLGFSAFSLNYVLGVLDHLSCTVYRDWTHREWYRLVTWQRTYDNWVINVMGYWNPAQIHLYHTQAGSSAFAGKGVQLVVVFNH